MSMLCNSVRAEDDEEEESTEEAANLGAPMLVTHKTVSESNVVLGGELKVHVMVKHIAGGVAYDVQLTDNSPDGQKSKQVAELKADESIEIDYVITPKELGQLTISQAKATYLAEKDGSTRLTSVSNVVREEERDERRHAQTEGERGFVNVLTSAQYEKLNTKYIKETILYLISSGLLVVFPYFVYRQKLVQVETHLRECRKQK